jgi:hypothetical protein
MHPTQNLWYHDVTSASSTNTAAPRTHGVTQTPCPHIKSNIDSRCYVQQTSPYHGPITISDSWLATRDPLRQERNGPPWSGLTVYSEKVYDTNDPW